jgi:toxin-antitoxin system PIN domain toxin
VWVALSSPDHEHFAKAWRWYKSLDPAEILCFCRITQLGLLRLLTTQPVMGLGTLTQTGAWNLYDRWLSDASAEFLEEPVGMDIIFRSRTQSPKASPKEWADAYLAAFAESAHLTLITFDKALAAKAKGAVLLA